MLETDKKYGKQKKESRRNGIRRPEGEVEACIV